ncbi:MAG: 50S ribosomal protein L10 [Victivallaceae bacterium]|nr:50S ribosomal protein L10 [Victivallaceae bacterium]
MRSEKTHLANYIGGLLKDSDFVYFVSYKGLNVADFSDFRNLLAGKNAQCHVLKNRMIRKAAELFEIGALAEMELKDSTAVISGSGDPGAIAKIITEFGDKNKAVAPKGGYFEGVCLSVNDVNHIASLPPKEVLQAQLLGVLQAPARDFVSVLNAKAATILNVLNAYKDKLES